MLILLKVQNLEQWWQLADDFKKIDNENWTDKNAIYLDYNIYIENNNIFMIWLFRQLFQFRHHKSGVEEKSNASPKLTVSNWTTQVLSPPVGARREIRGKNVNIAYFKPFPLFGG